MGLHVQKLEEATFISLSLAAEKNIELTRPVKRRKEQLEV